MIAVDGLTIRSAAGRALVDGVSLAIGRAEAVGLVGPSGCGKSTLALALLGHLRPGCARTAGTVRHDQADLFGLAPAALRRLRGRRIALVPQDPASALTPTLRCDAQIAETLAIHRPDVDPASRIAELMNLVHLDPELASRYPHALSGGQRQRIALALALAPSPDLLILDETTTGLDAINRQRVLELLRELRASGWTALLVISHDLDAVRALADRVLEMESGKLIAHEPPAPAPAAPGSPRPGAGAPVLTIPALDLAVHPGETLALVGLSGAGKTTLARRIVGLADRAGITLREHTKCEIVFQNPDASLNPRHTIARILSRPLTLAGSPTDRAALAELLMAVHLPAAMLDRYPSQLSGGERQRVAIARAFAANPALVVCDEVVSALDASARGAVLDLLAAHQRERGTAYLFITHDLSLLPGFAHRIAVIHEHLIVEQGPVEAVLSNPQHALTQQLLKAARRTSAARL